MFKIAEKIGTEVKINIFPRQADMINSDCDDLLYGGAAGGGKSAGLLLFGLKRRLENPKSTGILFRRTYPELEKSLIRKSFEIYPLFGARYNESKHRWTFPNDSVEEFGFCEKEADVYRYQSAEYDDIGFDEASHFTEFQITYLTTRCRSSNSAIKPLIRLASNPGNVGHAYLKARYIDPSVVNKKWFDPETRRWLTFIPAKLVDNPALSESDPGYTFRLKELRKVSEDKYLSLAEGRWDVFEGAFFAGFDPRPGFKYVLSQSRKPDTYTRKIIAMDWGYAEPCCVLWFEITPIGRIFIFRELYTTQKSPKELGNLIIEMTPADELATTEFLCAPPELWGKKSEVEGGGETYEKLISEGLGGKLTMIKANNARKPGWTKVREFFAMANDGFPWVQISPDCIHLRRTLPGLIHDNNDPEDLNDSGEDHAADAMRYGLVAINLVPKSINTPYASGYHKIFGIKSEGQKMYSDLPHTGTNHGGY